jgi:hypothetical protein
MRFLTSYILATSLIIGCASRQDLASDYSEKTRDHWPNSNSKSTVVVFLIDGLSYEILNRQIAKKLPSMKHFFKADVGRIAKAHSVFPSLTFPNIASLLREAPVHETEMIGNKFVAGARLIDFEDLKDRTYFTKLMRGNNIFTRLNLKNQNTLSLDYGLGRDATNSAEFDFKSAYSASQLDYRYLDLKKIDALTNLLSQSKVSQWPNFIFVHLVGFDFLSHRYGPRSQEALSYLKNLDTDLNRVFSVLKSGERSRQVVTLLTADHGFNLTSGPTQFLNIEKLVQKVNPRIKVINESRFAGLFCLNIPSKNELIHTSDTLLQERKVETVVFRKKTRIYIHTKTEKVFFDELPSLQCGRGGLGIRLNATETFCTNQLPQFYQNKFYPFFIENIASYFQAKNSPDMVVIPNATTSFSQGARGFHGGPTKDEVIVPLLIRNATSVKSNGFPALWNLLKFVE